MAKDLHIGKMLGLFGSLIAAMSPMTCSAANTTCAYPSYCARTDQKIELYPKVVPVLEQAGSKVVDPDFGSQILRVTDQKTEQKRTGGALMTPSSAEQNSWNSASTRFYVVTGGGQFLLYDFDPSTMTAHQSRTPDIPWGGEPQFSYTDPNLLYGFGTRSTEFQQYNIENGKVTTLHDAASCVKLNGGDIGHSITVSADEKRMETSLGPRQGDNYLIYVFDRELGCRWYNTSTGEIGGKWGPTGRASTPDRFKIHNARMSKSGKYIYIARAQPQPHHHWVIWDVDTMNAVVCPSECGGHRRKRGSPILCPEIMPRNPNYLQSRLDTQYYPM